MLREFVSIAIQLLLITAGYFVMDGLVGLGKACKYFISKITEGLNELWGRYLLLYLLL